MDMRYPIHPDAFKHFDTDQLRTHFLIEHVFIADQLTLTYSHIDRMIIGGALPVSAAIALSAPAHDIGAETFLERREIGIVNIGGAGMIAVDGETYAMARLDGLYIGKGARHVSFSSADPVDPARFYFTSAPAHQPHPTTHIPITSAIPVHLGDASASNVRTIYKYIHADGVASCQLVLGVTLLEPGCLWNTMPPHLHTRRMEVYLYFDVPDDAVVFHLMGQPDETRHLVLRSEQAVISPSWSIHAGMGTRSYGFVWAMAGENQAFNDMDAVAARDLR